MTNYTLFSQILGLIDKETFKKEVKKHGTDYANKGFDSWTHLVAMLFCQIAQSTSVRDISFGLRSASGNLNHLGVQRAPSKSSISYQNKHRDYRLFRDTYYNMLNHLGQHPGLNRRKLRIKAPVYLLDSTTISLCLSLFDWAQFRTTKGAIKLHTLLQYNGQLPAYLYLSDGKTADNRAARDIPISKGSVVVADRYYTDFALLNIWDSTGVNFVVRHKSNLQYWVKQELKVPKNQGGNVIRDQIIELYSTSVRKKYPREIRRVEVWDEENLQTIELLTNNLKYSGRTIAALYKARWDVELFFRDLKQLLHVKTFIGTSENAVQIQIWSALIAILLLKYLKMKAKFGWHLSNLVQSIRTNCFAKIDLFQWIDEPLTPPPQNTKFTAQGVLF